MNTSSKNLDSFDKYYAGRMSAEEQENFEMALNSNSNLYDAFREYMDVVVGINLFAEEKNLTESSVKQMEASPKKVISMKQDSEQSSQSFFSIKPYLFFSAAALFVCLFGFKFYQSHLINDLVTQYAYQNPTTMGTDNTAELDMGFEKGIYLKSQQKQTAALQAFEQIKQEDEYFYHAQVEIALISIEAGNLLKAKTALSNVVTHSKDESLKREAQEITETLASVWFWF